MANSTAVIVIREQDNVGTATRDIKAGELIRTRVGAGEVCVTAAIDIRFLHKIALRDISTGERIYKYGAVIGEAISPIAAGDHVHVHNIRSLWGRV